MLVASHKSKPPRRRCDLAHIKVKSSAYRGNCCGLFISLVDCFLPYYAERRMTTNKAFMVIPFDKDVGSSSQ